MSDLFNLPVLKANLSVKGSPTTSKQLHRSLRSIGRSAQNIAPVDWRSKIQISPPLNQQNCGDCWVVAACGALTDRFIWQKNIKNLHLNPAYGQCMSGQGISLDKSCFGGLPFVAGKYFEKIGIPEHSESCDKYWDMCEKDCVTSIPTCQDLTKHPCNENTKYKAVPGSTNNTIVVEGMNVRATDTITNTKLELHHGPIVSCFFVPIDFYVAGFIRTKDYPNGYVWDKTNGVFINGEYNDEIEKLINQMDAENPGVGTKLKKNFKVSSPSGWGNLVTDGGRPSGHAVELVGWDNFDAGKYGKIPAWIIKNSWGDKWAEKGYCKIAMNSPSDNSENIKFNQNLGFDVPITRWKDSFGNLNSLGGGVFGGGTKFDPDLNSGREEGYDYNPDDTTPFFIPDVILPILTIDFATNNIKRNIFLTLLFIGALFVIAHHYKKK